MKLLLCALLCALAVNSEKTEKSKKKAEKGGDFGTVWGRQGEKICLKQAESDQEKDACGFLGDEIKDSFNRMTGFMSMNAGGNFDINSLMNGANKGGSNKAKALSLKPPYKGAGMRLLKKMIKENILPTAKDWTDPVPEEPQARVEGEEPPEDAKPKEPETLQTKVKALVSEKMMTWLFDVIMSKPALMSFYGTSRDTPEARAAENARFSGPTREDSYNPPPRDPPKKRKKKMAPKVEEMEEEESIDLDHDEL